MLYKYVGKGLINQYGPATLAHKYYRISELEELRDQEKAFYAPGPEEKEDDGIEHHLTFHQAIANDMEGVYDVAHALFGHTTSAEDRKPLISYCPVGNYVVRDNGQIVAFVHIQPLKPDRLAAFLQGDIRGSQIRKDDLECFTPGKPTNVLIKSVGAIGKGKWQQHYIQRLLFGTARELGRQGVNLSKVYATSETDTGIAMSIHAGMHALGKIGPHRFAFELNVPSSDLPALRLYKRAYADWQAEHECITQEKPLTSPTEPPVIWQTVVPPTRRTTPEKAAMSPQNTIADDSIALRLFAEMHHVKTRTASDQARIGTGGEQLQATEQEATPGRDRWFLSPEQQRQAVQFWQRHKTPGFTPCERCPH